jgi:hypothetical protein
MAAATAREAMAREMAARDTSDATLAARLDAMLLHHDIETFNTRYAAALD